MSNIELNLKFLKRLQGKAGITEISNLQKNLGGIEDYENLIKGNKDLYFVSFVPNEERAKEKEKKGKLIRSRDEHVKAINYVRADFDIRRYIYETQKRVISEEELLLHKDRILAGLDADERLNDYTCVVHSGNGIHIYRIGKMLEIDARWYSEATFDIFGTIKYQIFPKEPHLWPDYSCRNISRLLRLPGSFNHNLNHKKDYGLPPHEVEILYYREEDSHIMDYIEKYDFFPYGLDSTFEEIYWEIEDSKHLSNYVTGLVKNGENLFERINREINIADLVCEYTGWKVAKNGKNFISCRNGGYTGAFLVPEDNIVVHWGTPHFSDHFRVYSPYAFILVHYANGDTKRAFEIALEKFPWLKEKGDLSNGLKKNGGQKK